MIFIVRSVPSGKWLAHIIRMNPAGVSPAYAFETKEEAESFRRGYYLAEAVHYIVKSFNYSLGFLADCSPMVSSGENQSTAGTAVDFLKGKNIAIEVVPVGAFLNGIRY